MTSGSRSSLTTGRMIPNFAHHHRRKPMRYRRGTWERCPFCNTRTMRVWVDTKKGKMLFCDHCSRSLSLRDWQRLRRDSKKGHSSM